MIRIRLSLDGRLLGEQDFAGEVVRVGSGPQADLRLEDPLLAELHLEVFRWDDRLFVRPLSNKPCAIGGKPVQGKARLQDKPVEVGPFSFHCREAVDEPIERALPALDAASLLPLRGVRTPEQREAEEGEAVLARARRMLSGRGATREELAKLDRGDLEFARAALLEGQAQGLDPDGRLREGVAPAPRPRRGGRITLGEALRWLVIRVALLTLASLLAWRLYELVAAFTS